MERKNAIVALTTPNGRSGIAVIRLSGDNSFEIIEKLTETALEPRIATLRKIRDTETSEVIDECILTYFKAPNSFTGEDVIEIGCHGSPIIVRQIIDACVKLDARIAAPGEFSLRAVMNGRINLSQAEAVRDLIEAETVSAARLSLRQLDGGLSKLLEPIKNSLLDSVVILESALEFVEDDLPEVQKKSIQDKLIQVAADITDLASTYEAGKLIRDGLRIAFVGRPNVGKSSIFNMLLGYDRAIVTDIAGTTRDSLNEKLVIENIPISLIDTAGLRETHDLVETIGVQRSRSAMADADLVVGVLDCSKPLTVEDKAVIDEVSSFAHHLFILNKIDLGKSADFKLSDDSFVEVSAKHGSGRDLLCSRLVQSFKINANESEGLLISDARHFDLLNRSAISVTRSIELFETGVSEELVLVGLHNAVRFLGEISGEFTTEDLLTRVFSTFCIGK